MQMNQEQGRKVKDVVIDEKQLFPLIVILNDSLSTPAIIDPLPEDFKS
jgi:hypothetical protein